ncbi:MAG: hypothetical protein JXR96_11785 [Deltaproteobacteria bacterium]|nr:hypothetical protein [Deltaproteobacteria bacterium]
MATARPSTLSLLCLLWAAGLACCSQDERCGNGVAGGDEACDGADLGELSCEGLGFRGGELACDADCRPDTRGCTPYLELGEICNRDDECESGRCLTSREGAEGYCSTAYCRSDADCVNHGKDGAEMCCAETEPGSFICQKIALGYACGDGTGGCGAPCTGTGDSACLPGHPCLSVSLTDPRAYCSHLCTTDRDCDGCGPEDPERFRCMAISGGERFCLDMSDPGPCTSSHDCTAGEVCMLDVVDDILRGTCGRQGALDPGAACNDEDDPGDLRYEERCAAVFCFYDMCSEICTLDSDCPAGMTCETVGFIDMPDQSIDMCFGPIPVGNSGPGDPCIFNGVNADSDHCQEGLACLGYDTAQLNVSCEDDADCERVISPAENPDCTAEGLCGASFCAPPCEECPEGFSPTAVGGACYCIPQEIGTSGPGDPCPFAGSNDDADYCQSGLACLGYDREAIYYPCDSDEDCLDALPPAENPDCAYDGLCGASFCSPPCDENDQCEPGFYPALVGDQCYCIPETTGSSGAGDPCPFNGTHMDADYCESGLACLGYDRDAVNTRCDSDDDCLEVLPPAENPECAPDMLCGASFCSARCDENGECEPGFYPALVDGDGCRCIPE